jgi:hypothetical protein
MPDPIGAPGWKPSIILFNAVIYVFPLQVHYLYSERNLAAHLSSK